MKYCHSCRYEFKDEIDVCPDCGVPLRDEPPVPEKYIEEDWVQLCQLNSPIYAEMVKEILDNENVPNYLSFDFITSAFIVRGSSLVGESGKLFVPVEFKEQAWEIIQPIIEDEGTEPE